MGTTRVRRVLGVPERMVDLDVLAGGHGDIPGPLQSVPGVLLPRDGHGGEVGRVAHDDLDHGRGQSAWRAESRSGIGRCRHGHPDGISSARTRRSSTHHTRAVAAAGAAWQARCWSLGVGLSIALWNYVGWDNASTVQGEVVDASRSYPAALARALPLVLLAYMVPMLPALGATDWRTWHEGGWPDIARAAVGGTAGNWLAMLLALGGMVSAIALFNALLMAYSRIPFAMARDGVLPAVIGRTDDRGVPRVAIVASAVVYSIFALVPFADLVVADVVLYSLALFLEFAALVHFRRYEPELRGAFRIPVGTVGVVLISTLPVAVLVAVIALGARDGEYAGPALLGSLTAILAGPAAYALVGADRRRRAARASK